MMIKFHDVSLQTDNLEVWEYERTFRWRR